MKKTVYLILFLLLGNSALYSQCTGGTPLFIVDLSSSPTATWTSSAVARAGNCCSDNNCVAFEVTLHPDATEIALHISSGAIPTGSLFYQIGCGGLQSVGSITCISGVGPHLITFCKPGNNINTYSIISNPVSASPDFSMYQGDNAPMFASGLTAGTIQWNSISPGASGSYNSYLSCTNCANPTITAPMGAPPMVTYAVMGNAESGCLPITRYDTVNVTIMEVPLPIELENFTGNYNSSTRHVDLNWSTTSETNNRWFICEKSYNGNDWTCIDTIHSPGNSNTTQFYSCIDAHPSPLSYYRLTQEDWDGNQHMYDPISVYAQDKETVSCHIYPNPNEGDFYIQFNQGVEGVLYLTDETGKLCNTTLINSMCQEIQTNDLPPGTYFVEVRLERFFYGTKIIIQ